MRAHNSRLFSDTGKNGLPMASIEGVELDHLNKANGSIFELAHEDLEKLYPAAKDFIQALTDHNHDEAKELFEQADSSNKFAMLKSLLIYQIYNATKLKNHPLRRAINIFIETCFKTDEKKFKTSAEDIFKTRLNELTIVQWFAVLNEPELIDDLFKRFPLMVSSQVNYMSKHKSHLMISPLHIAAGYGYEEATACLLKHRADPFIRTSTGFKPIAIAAFRGHLNIVKMFHTDPNFLASRCNNDFTLMHHAAIGGNIEIVKYLHKHQVSLTDCTANGISPLMMSLKNGHDDISEYFYQHGAIDNPSDNDDKTLLHYACDSKQLSTLQLTLKNNRDKLDASNKRGVTPFYYAISLKFTEGAFYLMEQGCDYRKKSAYGCEPLHLAASFDNIELITKLLEAGVNYDAKATITREQLDLFAGENDLIKHQFLLAMRDKDSVTFTAEQIAEIYGAQKALELLQSKRRVDEELKSFTLM